MEGDRTLRGWETMKICEHSESGVGVEGEERMNAKRREGMRRERENKTTVGKNEECVY